MAGESIAILDSDRAAADWHAAETLAPRGEMPPFSDGQIAAAAAVHDPTLVALNAAAFRRLGYSGQCWSESDEHGCELNPSL